MLLDAFGFLQPPWLKMNNGSTFKAILSINMLYQSIGLFKQFSLQVTGTLNIHPGPPDYLLFFGCFLQCIFFPLLLVHSPPFQIEWIKITKFTWQDQPHLRTLKENLKYHSKCFKKLNENSKMLDEIFLNNFKLYLMNYLLN